jgi:hypothetical protein
MTGFENMTPDPKEAVRLKLRWRERAMVQLGQDAVNSSGKVGLGTRVQVRPRKRDAAGQLLASGARVEKYAAAKVIGKCGMKLGAGEEEEHQWVVRFNDGASETNVPRAAMRLPRVMRAADMLGGGGGGGGGNAHVVRWVGEPVRLVFAMDVPRGWPKATYADSVVVVQQPVDEETGAPVAGGDPTYGEQPVYVPMDRFCAAGHGGAAISAELARAEGKARLARMAASEDPSDLAAMLSMPASRLVKSRAPLFVPHAARASAADRSSLLLLHEALASKGVASGGNVPKATRSIFSDVDRRKVQTPKPKNHCTYCAVCGIRNAPCHHSLAREMKERRREAVYGRREQRASSSGAERVAGGVLHDDDVNMAE